jgi:hypothetical protein
LAGAKPLFGVCFLTVSDKPSGYLIVTTNVCPQVWVPDYVNHVNADASHIVLHGFLEEVLGLNRHRCKSRI